MHVHSPWSNQIHSQRKGLVFGLFGRVLLYLSTSWNTFTYSHWVYGKFIILLIGMVVLSWWKKESHCIQNKVIHCVRNKVIAYEIYPHTYCIQIYLRWLRWIGKKRKLVAFIAHRYRIHCKHLTVETNTIILFFYVLVRSQATITNNAKQGDISNFF